MKILFVTTYRPCSADSGGKIVSHNMVRQLRLRGHDVHVFALVEGTEHPSSSPSGSAASVARPRLPRRLRSIRGLGAWLTRPYPIAKYWDERTYRSLLDEAKAGDYDIVHCDHLHAAEYGLRLKEELGGPTVLTAHNVEHVLWRGFSAVGWNVPKRLVCRLESVRIRRYEARVVVTFDACLALSDEDARSLAALGNGGTVISIPPGIDPASFAPCPEKERAGAVVFCGRTAWPPNVDGVLWFWRCVWPRIHRQCPDARLWIVGGNPPRAIRRLGRSRHVEVTGWVKNPRDYLAMAQVVVAPLRIGSGVRIKILDALAMRRPVVSTPTGCGGLGVTDGREVLIGRHAEEFAEKTLCLLRHPERRSAMAGAAESFVRSWSSWDESAAAVEAAYGAAIASGVGKARHASPPAMSAAAGRKRVA